MKDPLAYINAIKEILNETDNVDDIGPGPTNRSKTPRLNVMPAIDPRTLQEGKISTPKRGFVDEPGSYAGRKVSEERLKFLNEAAEKYGYKDFESVEGRDNRINVAQDEKKEFPKVREDPVLKKIIKLKLVKKILPLTHIYKEI